MTPSSAFHDLGLSQDILSAVESAGFDSPTAIQAEGVPAFLEGGDVVFQAQTGTGKTAAFVLPIVEQLTENPGTVEVLVLTPTRELAQQVCTEFERFGSVRGLAATAIYGGTSFEKQFAALETAQIVVATPGRLLDLFRRKKFSAAGIRFFGLDEADELLSMGFEKDVLDIIDKLPVGRQNFICSATIDGAVQRVATNFIVDPVQVNVSSDEIGAKSVRHEHFKVRPSEKLDALRRLVHSEAKTGAIVFANTRAATFRVTDALAREDVSVDVLNGDLSQAEREKALARMKADHVQFLVATDVAARGIDISGLPAVINYDMPESPDVYIHRTGRTGRAGQAGVAYSLVMPSDITVFHALEKFYNLQFHQRDVPSRETIRAAVADGAIDDVLGPLDSDGTLEYAAFIPLARRLADRPDGPRTIAKLIAHFAGTNGETPAVPASRRTEEAPALPVAAPARPQRVGPLSDSADVESSTTERDADAPPQPRRARSGRRNDESPAPAVSAEPNAAPPSGDAPTADAIASVLMETSRRRGRWRGTRGIAEILGTTEDLVVAVLSADEERFEQSRKNTNQWRLTRRPDDDGPAEAREPAPKEPKKTRKAAESKPVRPAAEDTRAPAPAKSAKSAKKSPKFSFVKINLGTNHGVDPAELAAELVHLAGLDDDDLGPIELAPDGGRVPVVPDYADALAEAIDGQTVAGHTLEVKRSQRRGRRR